MLLVGAAGAKADADAARTTMAAADFMVGLDLLMMSSKRFKDVDCVAVSAGVWKSLSFVNVRTITQCVPTQQGTSRSQHDVDNEAWKSTLKQYLPPRTLHSRKMYL